MSHKRTCRSPWPFDCYNDRHLHFFCSIEHRRLTLRPAIWIATLPTQLVCVCGVYRLVSIVKSFVWFLFESLDAKKDKMNKLDHPRLIDSLRLSDNVRLSFFSMMPKKLPSTTKELRRPVRTFDRDQGRTHIHCLSSARRRPYHHHHHQLYL